MANYLEEAANNENIARHSQELMLSSPPIPSSRGTTKPRKPPPITPNRFNRFFNPRSRSSGQTNSSRSGRELRELTGSGANIRTNSSTKTFLSFDDLPDLRPTKRRKASPGDDSQHPYSSPLQETTCVIDSSPLASSPCPVPELYTDHEEATYREAIPYPKPIKRSKAVPYASQFHRLPDWRNNTVDFCTNVQDRYDCERDGGSLPFCTVACNTNSLVAIAQENGNVVLLDTDNSKDFSRSYLQIDSHRNAIMDLAFSDDDYLLASASGDQTANVIDMRSQRIVDRMVGHFSSVKQVAFQPGNNHIIATAGRDGSIAIWDRRSNRTSPSLLGPGPFEVRVQTKLLQAHHARGTSGSAGARSDSSITSLRFLPHDRSHLFVTGSDSNSRIKLWDLRTLGKRSQRRSQPLPVSTSSHIPSHQYLRSFGINSISVSNDGGRIYSVCKDSTVYAYSTNHLVLGSSPELTLPSANSKALRYIPIDKEGAAPLYGLRHSEFRTGTFYVKSAVRKTPSIETELLAVGSSSGSAVIFPTDERFLRNATPLSSIFYSTPPSSFSAALNSESSPPTRVPIYSNEIGTAFIGGHQKSEVTDVTWTFDGNLVTIGDDSRARCWRERPDISKVLRLRNLTKTKDKRLGWANVDQEWDAFDEPYVSSRSSGLSDELDLL